MAGSSKSSADSENPDAHEADRLFDDTSKANTDAFTKLYDTLNPAVWSLCLAITGDTEDAIHATQAAWMEIWRKAPANQHEDATTWILHRAICHATRHRSSTNSDHEPAPQKQTG